jgi:hypothetical protein
LKVGQSLKLKRGEFFADDSCNMGYYKSCDSLGYEGEFGLGIPNDSLEMSQIFYSRINDDDKLDALMLFYPIQCDGGNASMFVQYKLLILSDKNNYIVNDSLLYKINFGDGFNILDSINGHFVYGNYFEYRKDDPYPYPSIKNLL